MAVVKRKTTLLPEKKINSDFFEKFYLDFLLSLREGYSLPQNIINIVTSGFTSMIKLIYELFTNKIKNSSNNNQQTTTNLSAVDFITLTDINSIISNVIEIMTDVTKNE